MRTGSNGVIPPRTGDSPSNGDDAGGEDAVAWRRSPRVAVRKVLVSKRDQPSSSRGKSNIGVMQSPLKKGRKLQGSVRQSPLKKGCKLQGNEKGATGKFKSRFSVHRILELVPGFDEDQKKWIVESGHGSLLSMSEFCIPIELVKWIMQHTDPLLREFRFDGKVIVFDRPLVCKILGFENGTKPLDLSVDFERVDEFQKMRDQYRDGDRAKLKRCIEVLKSSKDKDSFMRAFMLLALGSVYCPGTTNAVCLKYLHSLYDVSKIKEFDWAGHILEVLMKEVAKYQKLSPEQLEHDHNIRGCLAIFAIAYMDHLDIPKDCGPHQICDDLPRICNVTKQDFEFVMRVDMNGLRSRSYGWLTFRAVTPYSTPPSTTEHPMADEVHVHSSATSLNDWLHPSGSSSQNAQNDIFRLVPPQYQPSIIETNSLIECDIDELTEAMAADFKVKCKGIYKNRLAAAKMINLTHPGPCNTCNATSKASTSGGVLSKVSDGTAGQGENNLTQTGRDVVDIDITEKISSMVERDIDELTEAMAADFKVKCKGIYKNPLAVAKMINLTHQGPCNTCNVTSKASTSGGVPPSKVFDGIAGQGENSLAQTGRDVADIDITENISSMVIDTVKAGACLESSNAHPSSSSCINSKEMQTSQPTTTAPIPGAANKMDVGSNKMNSSAFDKKNRMKRAALELNPGKKLKRIKLEEDARLAYETYVAKKMLIQRPSTRVRCELPPFIRIAGFNVTYEDFYESLKPRGHIANTVMTMWTYQFNHNCRAAWEFDNDIVKKFAFDVVFTDKLIVDPNRFEQESFISGLMRLDNRWKLSEMHLLFFPIVHDDHWVLVCINMFLHKIVFFNSIDASRDIPCFQCAKNLVENFAIAALASGVLKRDVSKFAWIYPTDYPRQKTLYDCGLYVMLYMEFWDGMKMDIKFDSTQIVDYRKIVAGFLLLSPMNEISTDDFNKDNC